MEEEEEVGSFISRRLNVKASLTGSDKFIQFS